MASITTIDERIAKLETEIREITKVLKRLIDGMSTLAKNQDAAETAIHGLQTAVLKMVAVQVPDTPPNEVN